MSVQGETVVTLNLGCCYYKVLFSVTKVSWLSNFILRQSQPYNFSDLSPW